jgi:TonB family protein
MSKRIALLLCLLATLAPLAGAQSDAWLEVRTPHFDIITNSNEKEGRRAAHQFEGMRSVFQRVFPEADLDTAEPMLVIAVQDKRALQALEPEEYNTPGQLGLVGYFMQAPEKNYVLILLNATGTHPYAPIYHEYAHFVFSRTHDWMPLWLTEGIAEFYENTEILDDRVRIGKGDPYLQSVLDRHPFLPLSTLFAVDQHSPYYHEQNKGDVFYAESWALTHYLKDKDDLDGTHRLNDFLDLLQHNVDPTDAATQAFGDLDTLELSFRKAIVSMQYAVSEISGSTDIDESSFLVQPLTQTQADVFRADMLAHIGREKDASMLAQGILRDDAGNVAAREIMGYIAYRQLNFEEARKWCQEAIKLDPNNFMAHYLFGVSSLRKSAPDKASQAAAEESLRTVIKLNPSFAEGYDALAMFYATRGTNLTEARDLMEKAVQLGPGVPEIRINQSQVLVGLNKTKEAAETLNVALKMSHTPEQVAAVEKVLATLRTYSADRAKMQAQNKTSLANPHLIGNSSQSSAAPGISPAHPIYSPSVEYTPEARTTKFDGECVLSLIVGIDGTPSNVVVTKKLGMGMDERAVETVSKWKFEPARRNGKPVPSRFTLQLHFKTYGGDEQKFLDLSQKARTGDPAAEFELANAFFEGRDIPKDEAQGMALLERAARSGNPQAQYEMGERVYGDGNEAEKYVDAYLWFIQAQRNGSSDAEAKVNELESRMTPDQLSEAHKRLATLQK